ncbi:1-phosphatidylinositol-4-phosphate 5-kinase [Trifolium repens]|nr:phosphatidylinositol 4-phosphate 5-kinase [Trifolium repens]WJX11822.1 1-phosphatidylinositol-4-phosphate 5-kinase [Trifolium repens]
MISPLGANWSLQNQVGDSICRDSSSTLPQPTEDGRSEALSISYMVVEREYMQGVRIKERIRQHSEITHNKNNKQDKFSVKQVKKSSCIRTFFLKIVKSII